MAENGSIGPAIPGSATSQGGVNESTPKDQRVIEQKGKVLDGPKRGQTDNFEPAKYKLESGNVRTDR